MNDFRLNNSFEQFSINNSYWSNYENLVKDMSNEQKNYVSKQKSVVSAKQNLMTAFIDYLFEQNRNSFVVASPAARNLADEYISAISKAANGYVTRSDELEKENADLKKQLQQLMNDFEGKNGKNKTTTD